MYTGLGDRVDNLNEQILRTKELMGLLIEKTSSTGVYHEWKECGDSTGPSVNSGNGIGFWVNGPGWNVGTQTGGSPTYPWATHQNSAAFWTFLQQPSPGTIVSFTVNNSASNSAGLSNLKICLEYIGTTQTIGVAGGGTFQFAGGNVLANVTSYSSGEGGCKECLGSQQQHACIGSYCMVDPNGPYSSLSDCQDCLSDPQCPCDNLTWKCVNKGSHPKFGKHCVSTNDGSGQFTNLQDCKDNCGPLPADKDKVDISIDGLSKMGNEPMEEGVINETDATTITPNFKVIKGLLDIDGKKYKLESEKMYMRISIDIVKVSTDVDGLSLTVEHPLSGKLMTNKIRQKNVDKVVNGAANNEDEIMVKNLDGKEFYLVKV